MHAEKYLIVHLQNQQLPVAGGNFWKKITVSENKLCYIFADNAIKELCVVKQAWRFGCMPATILNVVHAYYSEIATT